MSAFDVIFNEADHSPLYAERKTRDADVLQQLASLHGELLDISTPPEVVNASVNPLRIRRRLRAAIGEAVLHSIIDRLGDCLHDNTSSLKEMKDREAQNILRITQDWLDLAPVTHRLHRMMIYLLVKLCGLSKEFPPQLWLNGPGKATVDNHWTYSGGFADVYKGKYADQLVAVKRVRVSDAKHASDTHKTFSREALVWRQLEHEFILPFYGLFEHRFSDSGPSDCHTSTNICMVSPWMEKCTLSMHIETEAYQQTRGQSFYRLLWEVAAGLAYLHSQVVVHGDINDTNILINSEGHAQISDFGLVVVGTNTKGGMSATNNAAGTAGFMSPEQFRADNARKRTTTDDVYSFGGLCYFLTVEERPFRDMTTFQIVLRVAANDKHPQRPADTAQKVPLAESVWTLVTMCWQDQATRPPMKEIADIFAVLHKMGSIDRSESLDALMKSMSIPPADTIALLRKMNKNGRWCGNLMQWLPGTS